MKGEAARRLSRRSFLARVAGGVAAGGALALVVGRGAGLPGHRFGQRRQGRSGRARPRPDRRERRRSHRSRRLWPPAHRLHRRRQRHQQRSGRARPLPTGESDSDSGPNADSAGHGRPRTGISDSDSGARRRPGRAGPRPGECNDRDRGPTGDPPGRGRRCIRGARSRAERRVDFSRPKGFPRPA